MTFSVQTLSPASTATVTIDGTATTVTLTHAVTGYVGGNLKTFALCESFGHAIAISSTLQGAENAKTYLA